MFAMFNFLWKVLREIVELVMYDKIVAMEGSL